MTRTICIAGFSGLSREWANQQPDDVEIWAMNEGNLFLKRPAHYWFQLHPKNWNEKAAAAKGWDTQGYGRPPDHLKFLQSLNIPVGVQSPDNRIRYGRVYPYEEIKERYGTEWVDGTKRPYLTSTCAYLLALAVFEHDSGQTVDTIRLAGIELAIGTEYFHQRPCVEFWLGIACGRGIKVELPPSGTALMSGMIYAREHADPLYPESMTAFEYVPSPEKMPVVAVMQDAEGNPVGL